MAQEAQTHQLSTQQQAWCAQRREFLVNAGLLAAGAIGTHIAPANASAATRTPSTPRLSPAHVTMLTQLCELIIPRTDTPGAVDAAVPLFLQEVVTRWLTTTEFEVFMAGLKTLDDQANQRYGRAFEQCNTAQQTALLAQAQSRAYDYHRAHPAAITSDSLIGKTPLDPHTPFFTRLRELVTIGYQSSEVVVRTRMVYMPVPNRYDGEATIAMSGGKQYAW